MTDPDIAVDGCAGCPCLSRRAFVSRSALGVLGTVFAASCGDGQIGGPTGLGSSTLPGSGLTVTIADHPALASVGGIARVDGNSALPVAVTRTGPTSFLAHSMICPHAGYKPIQIVLNGFECPNHRARFAAEGNWIGGQHTRDLTRYTVVFNAGAGTLTITLPGDLRLTPDGAKR